MQLTKKRKNNYKCCYYVAINFFVVEQIAQKKLWNKNVQLAFLLVVIVWWKWASKWYNFHLILVVVDITTFVNT